jgi:CDP-glucose 4,6-dehydratase
LSLLLHYLGAEVHGLSLEPPTEPNFYTIAKVNILLASDRRLDICDSQAVIDHIHRIKPDVVFHLAAQSLVKYSYASPIETYAVNVMGTANILEAIRLCDSVRASIMVTTDKCYENREWIYPYRETDRLGGVDPYSSSKACAELVAAAYRSSYFAADRKMYMATVRAGNVIGGGDWAQNRLIPDCIRAHLSATPMMLRNPDAVRPWQHVLEPLHGYLLLAERLLGKDGQKYAEAWNFGPETQDMRTVGEVASQTCELLEIPVQVIAQPQQHEAQLLRLDSTKSKECLDWYPRWQLEQAVEETVSWYRLWIDGADMLAAIRAQIEHYAELETSLCLA